jgi:serine protease Do
MRQSMVALASDRLPATAALSSSAAGVAEALLESVVVVNGGWGGGSGVIWQSDGLIVTNSHVVHSDKAGVVLRDGTQLPGRLVARDQEHDLAALRVDRSGLPAATPGDSSRVRVGQIVLAAGNPLGMRGVVTAGIITGVGDAGGEAALHTRKLIRADVSLAPGNSGGPLADAQGRVLGINAMISSQGMALAIPTAVVQHFVASQRKDRPYIGIEGLPIQMRVGGMPRRALLLTAVAEGSPAERAGLLLGDVLLAFDGHDIETGEQFQSQLWAQKLGEAVRVAVLRSNRQAEVEVVPVERIEA